jgi:hypothetical protein
MINRNILANLHSLIVLRQASSVGNITAQNVEGLGGAVIMGFGRGGA